MNIDQIIQSKFLGVSDLKGKEPIVTIARVDVEEPPGSAVVF